MENQIQSGAALLQPRLVGRLPSVAGHMECSNREFEERCRFYIGIEQEKISPDNGLIAVLCDGARLAREYSAAMQSRHNADVDATADEKTNQRNKMPEIPENFDEAADSGLRLTPCSPSSEIPI